MKKILLFLLFTNIIIVNAQTEVPELTKKDSVIVSSWIFGLGFNAVDDSARQFDKLLDIEDEWNYVPYPSRLSIGKYFKSGLGLEAIAAYNKYKKGRIVQGAPLAEDKDYYSIDARLSYDLNKLIGETGWFDPYVGVGLGFTHKLDEGMGTFNGVVGFRTWFSDRIGLDFNSSGKWAMNSNYDNHLQHAVGVVYRFGIVKELTEEGQAKLDLINEIARANDSIAAANKAAEERAKELERLERQKEADRLAQLEREKEAAKLKEKNDIENKINALDKVHFAFDSASLTNAGKKTLSDLTSILNEYPKLQLEISSHTDSRGTSVYNQSLSERRLKSTLDYLTSKGVDSSRIEGKAFGEERLLNECDDNTKCSESKHAENRRSDFKIINH
jgi:OOP family OmpA-OmpF porin